MVSARVHSLTANRFLVLALLEVTLRESGMHFVLADENPTPVLCPHDRTEGPHVVDVALSPFDGNDAARVNWVLKAFGYKPDIYSAALEEQRAA